MRKTTNKKFDVRKQRAVFLKDSNNTLMKLDKDYCYKVYKLRDARFDGQFFIGVISTGIYCRPVCNAKMPKQKNCRFFKDKKTAESSGFRPCLRCRPELAPGNSIVDATIKLAQSAKGFIEQGLLNNNNLEQLAKRLGITSRHLRRIFVAQFGMTPSKFAQIQRLLFARHLLINTALSITDVALAVGFGSLRQFNTLFKRFYQNNPTHFRQNTAIKEKILKTSFDQHAIKRFMTENANSYKE